MSTIRVTINFYVFCDVGKETVKNNKAMQKHSLWHCHCAVHGQWVLQRYILLAYDILTVFHAPTDCLTYFHLYNRNQKAQIQASG